MRQRHDFVWSCRHIPRDDAVLTDKKRDRSRENAILPGQFPFLLKHHRKLDSVLPRLFPVLLRIAASHHHDGETIVLVFTVQLSELRR